jgi:hypothetical protein
MKRGANFFPGFIMGKAKLRNGSSSENEVGCCNPRDGQEEFPQPFFQMVPQLIDHNKGCPNKGGLEATRPGFYEGQACSSQFLQGAPQDQGGRVAMFLEDVPYSLFLAVVGLEDFAMGLGVYLPEGLPGAEHSRKVALNLLGSAPGEKDEIRFADAIRTGGRKVLQKWVSNTGSGEAHVLEKGRLKGEEGNGTSNCFTKALHSPWTPSPVLRADVIKDRNPPFLALLGKAEVQTWIVNGDEEIGGAVL